MSGITFAGLASGLDSATLIARMMQVERIPISRIERRIAAEQGRLTLFQTLNTNLLALTSNASPLKTLNTFEERTVTSDNESLVTARATSSSATGTFGVEVLQMARSQQISSTASWSSTDQQIGMGGDILVNGKAIQLKAEDTISGVVNKINDAGAGVSASLVQLSAGDYRISITSNETGAKGIALADANDENLLVNALGLTTLSTQIAIPLVGGTGAASNDFNSKAILLGQQMGLSSPQSGTITIDDGTAYQIEIDLATDTLDLIAGKINALGGSLSASVVERDVDGTTQYRLEITGAGGLEFTDDNNILQTMGFLKAGFANETQTGQDAKVKVNGLQITRSTNTISDAINGITFNLRGAQPGTIVNVAVSRDQATIKTSIQNFVNAFNSIKTFIGNHASYDAEKKTAGVLLGDFTIRQVAAKLDQLVSYRVPGLPMTRLTDFGDGVSPGSIRITDRAGNTAEIDLSGARTIQDAINAINSAEGIQVTASLNVSQRGLKLVDESSGDGSLTVEDVNSTTAANLGILGSVGSDTLVGLNLGDGRSYSLGELGMRTDATGKIQIDTDKLDELLSSNPDLLKALFATTDFGIGTVAANMANLLTDPVKGTLKAREDSIQATIKDMTTRIGRIEDRLSKREANLRRQFTALEATISQYQTIGTYLGTQLDQMASGWVLNRNRR